MSIITLVSELLQTSLAVALLCYILMTSRRVESPQSRLPRVVAVACSRFFPGRRQVRHGCRSCRQVGAWRRCHGVAGVGYRGFMTVALLQCFAMWQLLTRGCLRERLPRLDGVTDPSGVLRDYGNGPPKFGWPISRIDGWWQFSIKHLYVICGKHISDQRLIMDSVCRYSGGLRKTATNRQFVMERLLRCSSCRLRANAEEGSGQPRLA